MPNFIFPRFSSIETRLKAVSTAELLPSSNNQPEVKNEPITTKIENNHTELDHPLANHEKDTPPPSPSVVVPKLVPVTKVRVLARKFKPF